VEGFYLADDGVKLRHSDRGSGRPVVVSHRGEPLGTTPHPPNHRKGYAMTTPTITPTSHTRISHLAPAYYLGRPAHLWVDALCRTWRPSLVVVRASQPAPAAA
jgi:hypothetical protein